MAAPFPARIPKLFRKTITFDGKSGSGAVGTVKVGDVTGAVCILYGGVRCTTSLDGASATIELGTAADTDGLVATTTATDLDAGEFWQDSTPEAGVSNAIVNKLVTGDIIITVGTAAVSAGVIEVVFYWVPLSSDGQLA